MMGSRSTKTCPKCKRGARELPYKLHGKFVCERCYRRHRPVAKQKCFQCGDVKRCQYKTPGKQPLCCACKQTAPKVCGTCGNVKPCPYKTQAGPQCRNCRGKSLDRCEKCRLVRVVVLPARLCVDCGHRVALRRGVCFERWPETVETVHNLAKAHRQAWTFVQVWLLPRGTCLYVAARWQLFREFGYFAGMVEGPATTKPRTGPALAHLESLRTEGLWPPPGDAPVVVCLFPGETLGRFNALPPVERSRLHAVQVTLSRRGVTRGELRDRCASALASAGLPARLGRSTAQGLGSKKFCDYFYPLEE